MSIRSAIAIAVASMASAATAGPVTIQLIDPSSGVHSGWQVTVPDEDMVDVVTDAVSFKMNLILIEKAAEFINLNPVDLVFQQVQPDVGTVSSIWINDEIIVNSSGADWPSFVMSVTGPAVFDPVGSAMFSINPYTISSFTSGNTVFTVSGGTVFDSAIWTPGMASGVLKIDVNLSDPNPVTFTLREQAIPTPGALALLALGGVVALRRWR